MKNSKRKHDTNGWYEIQDNPLSKVGVFSYLGSSMGIAGVEPNKIYQVYRPADSLMSENFLNSLKLLPWIDEHQMLGGNGRFKAAEEHGIEGVVGENVYFENDTVYGNIKIFSEDLKQSIESGKSDLSLGYTARYERQSGIFNGERYDFIQREMLGNHLALVSRGRMGSDVAVLDEQLSMFKTQDGETMNKTELAKALAAQWGVAFDAALSIVESKGVGLDMGVTFDMDAMKTTIKDEVSSCMDSYMSTVKDTVKACMDEFSSAGTGMDEDTVTLIAEKDQKIADQDAELETLRGLAQDQAATVDLEKKKDLVEKLSPVVGAFDHDDMSLLDVAKYGIDKLGLEAPEGAEMAILNTHLSAVENSGGRFSVTDKADKTAATPSAVSKHLSEQN